MPGAPPATTRPDVAATTGIAEMSRPVDLSTLAAEIVREHEAVRRAAASALQHARRAGELLIQVQDQVGHGRWSTWLKANFPSSARTARLYQQVARGWSELEAKANGNALPLRDAARLLAAPSPGRGVRLRARHEMELRRMREQAPQSDDEQSDGARAEPALGNGPDMHAEQGVRVQAEQSTQDVPTLGRWWENKPKTASEHRDLTLRALQAGQEAWGVLASIVDTDMLVEVLSPAERVQYADVAREGAEHLAAFAERLASPAALEGES